MPASVAVSHFGICVSDLDRALKFYCGAFGFSEFDSLELENEHGNTMGLDNFKMSSHFLSLGDVSIELLHFSASENPKVATELRKMNHTGLTHLSLAVDDLADVMGRVEANGGYVFPETKTTVRMPERDVQIIYCADPDFTRVELVTAWR